ncbi:MAG TPA: S16 family serine protease [Chloroflexota bacterium]|nr:S16 family serine protease [Chloroflexota bacterium]
MSSPVNIVPAGGTRIWSRVVTVVLVVLAAAAGALELVPVHYYAIVPGDALPVQRFIHMKGYPPPKGAGRLYMVDVGVIPVDHLLEKLYWETQPNTELDKAQAVSGNLSNAQYEELNNQLMRQSIQTAEIVALRLAGYRLSYLNGPVVVLVLPHYPADGKVHVGDIIEGVDGSATPTIEAVSAVIKARRPGSVVTLSVVRHAKKVLLHVPTKSVSGKAVIGIEAQNRIHMPVSININPGDIGGPSGGLMFTLGLVERLEHRDLAHGCRIAGTGEIEPDGSVYAIGGAPQKVVAAEQKGAVLFLVPDYPDNVNPARAHAHNVRVVPVKTARQALRILNAIHPCRP